MVFVFVFASYELICYDGTYFLVHLTDDCS